MKNLLTFFIFCLTILACKNNSEHQTTSSQHMSKFSPFANEIIVFSDILSVTKDANSGDSFYVTGNDIRSIQMIGIGHNDKNQASGVNRTSESGYNFFWDAYLDATKKKPDDVHLAIEVGTTGLPDNVHVGNVLHLTKPLTFVNQHIFDLGLRNVVISDPRIKTLEMVAKYEKAGNLFAEKGGTMKIDRLTNSGFPIVTITRYPKFSETDIVYLRTKWYEECYKQDRNFEETIWSFCQKGAMGITGAAHALRLVKIHHAKAVFTLSENEMNDVAAGLERERYYLYIIGKSPI